MQLKKFHIIKICLIGFLLTFALIYLIEINYKQKTITISKIDSNYLEKNVKIQGKIIKQTLNNNTLFLTIKDNSSQINIIVFKTNKTFSKNYTYEIEGKVTTYRKELEIIANKINFIS